MSKPLPFDSAAVDRLEDQICPLLAGRHPALQGAVLACLVARWLAGHAPALRADILSAHLKALEDLVPLYADKVWRAPDD